MQDITKLKTKNWQHKRGTMGEVVTDIYDIEQCIQTIAMTEKGEVPFAPEFGCPNIKAIGENPQDSIEYLTVVYLKELPRQEPRCEIIDITGNFDDNGRVKMTIYFKDKLNNLTDKTEFYI